MQRQGHRRGFSQQITTHYKNRDKGFLPQNRQYVDIKYCHAFSSEQTRSTAGTSKPTSRPKHKKSLSNKQGPTKQEQYYTKKNNEWRPDGGPFSYKQILKHFSHMLEPFEREEIKEYQSIYYIGANKREQLHTHHNSLHQYDRDAFYKYRIGDHIAYRYEILDSINRGSFGQVLKVYDYKTKEIQALKIIKKMPELIKQTFVQISILTNIKEKDREDLSGIVRIKDFTIFRDHICILFQLLEANLYELMFSNDFKGLEEPFVRVFSIQILNSLNFLRKNHIVHCDIKLQNIVLKSWGKSGVKLVDFGTSCFEDQQTYTYIQSRYYRAPQIIFQHRYTCSIDMWSFACMVAQLCLGKPLFPGTNNLHQLFYMTALLGFPEPDYSYECRKQFEKIKSKGYLAKDSHGNYIQQKIQSFEEDTGLKVERDCLEPLEKRLGKQHLLVTHFLYQILCWNPKNRITPAQALQHPWILSGLPEQIKQLHTMHDSLEELKKKNQVKIPKSKKSKSKSKSRSKESRKNGSTENKKKFLSSLGLKSLMKTVSISPNPQKSKSKERNKQRSKILKKKSTQKKKEKQKKVIL